MTSFATELAMPTITVGRMDTCTYVCTHVHTYTLPHSIYKDFSDELWLAHSPSVFFLHLFQKETFGDKWQRKMSIQTSNKSKHHKRDVIQINTLATNSVVSLAALTDFVSSFSWMCTVVEDCWLLVAEIAESLSFSIQTKNGLDNSSVASNNEAYWDCHGCQNPIQILTIYASSVWDYNFGNPFLSSQLTVKNLAIGWQNDYTFCISHQLIISGLGIAL